MDSSCKSILFALLSCAAAVPVQAPAAETTPVPAAYPRQMVDSGWCRFTTLKGDVLLHPQSDTGPNQLNVEIWSADKQFSFAFMAMPTPNGPSLGPPTLEFRKIELDDRDTVSIDGRVLKAYHDEEERKPGEWEPDDRGAYFRALGTGNELKMDVVRDGKRETRTISLADLRAAVAAAYAVKWKCK